MRGYFQGVLSGGTSVLARAGLAQNVGVNFLVCPKQGSLKYLLKVDGESTTQANQSSSTASTCFKFKLAALAVLESQFLCNLNHLTYNLRL